MDKSIGELNRAQRGGSLSKKRSRFSRQPNVTSWVSAGGVLIFHSRWVANVAAELGTMRGTLSCTRDFAFDASIDVSDATTPVQCRSFGFFFGLIYSPDPVCLCR